MCNVIMCQMASGSTEFFCLFLSIRPFPHLDHTVLLQKNCFLLLTFVRDLTFDLTFCRLFSFFLLKAFFPLKANS